MEEKVSEKIKYLLITYKQKSLLSIHVFIFLMWQLLKVFYFCNQEWPLDVWLFCFLFLFLNKYVTIYEAQCGISAHMWLALINQNG